MSQWQSFSDASIKLQVGRSIKPQLDECDRLLDYYTEWLPREVWEPILHRVATDHYGHPPYPPIVGSFAELIERLSGFVEDLFDLFKNQPTRDDFVAVP